MVLCCLVSGYEGLLGLSCVIVTYYCSTARGSSLSSESVMNGGDFTLALVLRSSLRCGVQMSDLTGL